MIDTKTLKKKCKSKKHVMSDVVQEKLKKILKYYKWDDIDDINWGKVFSHSQLSEEFIEEFKNKVSHEHCWMYISIHQKLSEAFMDRHQYKLDWGDISRYQKLSRQFIIKHQRRLNINYLIKVNKFKI